ncbi:uncharacterized protein LOC119598238 [Penaeus monodon]|uniref:uncharacterized protein LOC119598238 n=1 Tax=Penaeus monodon TaxID=6687 RepID=UPI0018A7B6D0|nr:uncharacterized protein LOC119598238 [Penaeus monodon]XP_037803813.1 uncharacterized protein LOC119598238 [Penaeus monodon]
MVLVIPSDPIIARPSWGATFKISSPMAEPTTPGGSSVAVWGVVIPIMFFFDSLFSAREGDADGGLSLNSLLREWSLNDGDYDDYVDDDDDDDDDEEDDSLAWEDQQAWALSWVEEVLSWQGLDGRACVQRFICELQHRTIHKYSVLGETMALLFRMANSSSTNSVMAPYLEAEEKGQSISNWTECGALFPACPTSPFKLFGGKLNMTVTE